MLPLMKPFWHRQVEGLPSLEALHSELTKLQSAVRTLETEQVTLHDQVRKWMRRAVASEARAARSSQGSTPPPALPITSIPKPTSLRGARGRIYVRQLEEMAARAASVPAALPEPGAAAQLDVAAGEGE